MKIAQVAPLSESVPPHRYGGTERVVSYLTEQLVRQGEQVTLFASGDSKTAARLVPVCPRSLRLGKAVDSLAHHIVMLEEVFQRLDQFDIVHFHIDYLHFPLSRRASFPQVTTCTAGSTCPICRRFTTSLPICPLSPFRIRSGVHCRKLIGWARFTMGYPPILSTSRKSRRTICFFSGGFRRKNEWTGRLRSPGEPAASSRSRLRSTASIAITLTNTSSIC